MRLKRSRAARWVALVTTFALAGGCSALSSQPPPPRPMRMMSECSDARWPVYGDVYLAVNTGALAVIGLAGAAIVQSNASDEIVPSWDPHPSSASGVPTLLTLGMLATAATVGAIASARYGLRSAEACQAAQLELFRRMSETGGPPPPPWQ